MFALVNKAICYFSFVLIIYMLKLDYVVKPIHPRPATLPLRFHSLREVAEAALSCFKRLRLLVSSFKVWKRKRNENVEMPQILCLHFAWLFIYLLPCSPWPYRGYMSCWIILNHWLYSVSLVDWYAIYLT